VQDTIGGHQPSIVLRAVKALESAAVESMQSHGARRIRFEIGIGSEARVTDWRLQLRRNQAASVESAHGESDPMLLHTSENVALSLECGLNSMMKPS